MLLSLTHFSPSASQEKVTLFINFLLGRPAVKEMATILWNFDFHALGFGMIDFSGIVDPTWLVI